MNRKERRAQEKAARKSGSFDPSKTEGTAVSNFLYAYATGSSDAPSVRPAAPGITLEMDLEEAQETAERLRRKVAEEPQPLGNGEAVPLTISVGVAVYPDHGQTASTLCAAADKAMYLAKDRGRNCVAMAHLHDQVHNQ